jgi:hypothetical protein
MSYRLLGSVAEKCEALLNGVHRSTFTQVVSSPFVLLRICGVYQVVLGFDGPL